MLGWSVWLRQLTENLIGRLNAVFLLLLSCDVVLLVAVLLTSWFVQTDAAAFVWNADPSAHRWAFHTNIRLVEVVLNGQNQKKGNLCKCFSCLKVICVMWPHPDKFFSQWGRGGESSVLSPCCWRVSLHANSSWNMWRAHSSHVEACLAGSEV